MTSAEGSHYSHSPYLGSTKDCTKMSTCQDVGDSPTHTCNPIDIHAAEVGHSIVVTDGMHDKRQTLVHKLAGTE